ncbi:MAG: twin-arginine translocase TatA/TatE family subunit [Caldilineales bacterium]
MSGGLFGVGSGEIILILLIILIVMGPERLPQIARIWGQALRYIRQFSNTWNQMNTQLMRQIDEEAKPVTDALRPQDEPQPKQPVVDASADSGPEPDANTIAPPEMTGQTATSYYPSSEESATPPTPPASDAADTAEPRDA